MAVFISHKTRAKLRCSSKRSHSQVVWFDLNAITQTHTVIRFACELVPRNTNRCREYVVLYEKQ